MHSFAKKTTALVATAAAVGFSSLFLVAAPASAAPATCSNGAILLADNVCELTITTVGTTTITPTADMTQLEALLVAGGGSGTNSSQGYGSGGGGGQVTVVGFGTDTTNPVTVVVGGSGQASSAAQGATTGQSLPGLSGSGSPVGGSSGNGNTGGPNPNGFSNGSAGGGAGASAATQFDGGIGATAASVAPAGSLFSDDQTCYGGGGAYGTHLGTIGTASCGAGYVVDGADDVTAVAPVANSGGGGAGGGLSTTDAALRAGASGVVVLRWVALGEVTVTFDTSGRGPAVASQTFLEGGTATRPADPTATGFIFNGWFADAAFTVPADFTAALTESTTFYASWSSVATPGVAAPAALPAAPQLAATGGSIDPAAIPAGLAALGLGLGLVVFGARRARAAE